MDYLKVLYILTQVHFFMTGQQAHHEERVYHFCIYTGFIRFVDEMNERMDTILKFDGLM